MTLTQLPRELYHYCTWNTFEKIVTNKTWRFSSINGTNDISENLNLYVKQLLCSSSLFGKFSPNIRKNIIDEIENENYYNNKNYYIACFSTEKDDLGQWRVAYGDYGKGVCIGINPKFFTQNFYINNCDRLGWTEVSYNISSQKQRITQILEKYEDGSKNDWGIDNSMELAWEIRDVALTMKHRAFRIEHEWRMVVGEVDGNTSEIEFCPVCIEAPNPYIDYDIKAKTRSTCEKLFTSILIGADCRKTKKDVINLLADNGFKDTDSINIDKSNIPYGFGKNKISGSKK